jgi:DNA-directed RNA polymerase specialized sigma24 family protein
MKKTKEWLTVWDVARQLDLSRGSIYNLKKHGKLVPEKIAKNRRWFYTQKQVDDYIEKLEKASNHIREHEWFGDLTVRRLALRLFGVFIDRALKSLPDRDRKLLELRWGKDFTLEDVGRAWSVNRERVRSLEIKALRKLKYSVCYGEKLRVDEN